MAKKELGAIELQWTCPKCNSQNPGRSTSCQQCGAPQPAEVAFQQPASNVLLPDEAVKETSTSGPDIHCPYCGTRNPGNAAACSRCGGDLSGGSRREAGKVLGAFSTETAPPITCPRCGTVNTPQALTCQQCGAGLGQAAVVETKETTPPVKSKRLITWLVIGGIVVVCLLAGLMLSMLLRTDTQSGVVQDLSWSRSIPILALVPVENSDWKEQIPAEAELGNCEEKVREVSSDPVAGAEEVCGTPYVEDAGSGVGKVVQDCEYQVYASYCTYTTKEWRQVDQAVEEGDETTPPTWPEPILQPGQRLGEDQQETFTLVFFSDGKIYTFTTTDPGLFQQAEVGSQWSLKINQLGAVVGIEK